MNNAGSVQPNIDIFLDELADIALDSFLKHITTGSIVKKNSPPDSGLFNGRLGHQTASLVSSTGATI